MALTEVLQQSNLREASYVAKDSTFYRDPVNRTGRFNPIIVPMEVMKEAQRLLWTEFSANRMPRQIRYNSNDYDEFYLMDGAFIELRNRFNGPEYIGVFHETPHGIAYVTTKLLLPSDGRRLE